MKRNSTKRNKGLLAMVLSLFMFVTCAVTAVPVHAANIAPTDNLTTTFKKYLVMDAEANVPPVTFNFTISAGNAVEVSGSRVIYAGNDITRVTGFPVLKVGDVFTGDVTFSSTDMTYTTQQSGDTVSLSNGQKYAKKVITVDFTNVDFNSPGIYRYVISETGSAAGVENDNNLTRTLDVFVQYKESSETDLEVTNYVLYPGTKTDATNVDMASKDDGFTNEYVTNNLTLTKEVTGNQGDRDKYFEFTVNITNATAGTIYTVDLQNAEENPNVDNKQKSNPSSLTVISDGSDTYAEATFYLKDNQSIVIQGLTSTTKYKITEKSYTVDGYTTSYEIGSADSVTENTTPDDVTIGADDVEVTFTNHKEGTIPTGIINEFGPFVLLGVVILGGFVLLIGSRKRRNY